MLKIRMQKALDLLLRFSVFEQLDEDGDCFIDEEEAKSPVAKKAISKTGGGESVGAVRGGCDGGERQLPGLPRALRPARGGHGEREGARSSFLKKPGGCGVCHIRGVFISLLFK